MLKVAVMCLAVTAAACSTVGPPIQEMSDARLAVAEAEAVDADKYAPDEMIKARRRIRSAEEHLEDRAYAAARRDANLAKDSAVAAREAAKAARAEPPRFPEQPIKEP